MLRANLFSILAAACIIGGLALCRWTWWGLAAIALPFAAFAVIGLWIAHTKGL